MAPTEEQKARKAKLAQEIEAEEATWKELGLPPFNAVLARNMDPGFWVMNTIVLVRTMIEILGVNKFDMDLMMQEQLLKELQEWRGRLLSEAEARAAEELRQEITRGIHFKPPNNIKEI